ncbi:Metallo-dependent phosphatase-like protein, partial [Panaeolus papilionaceus]
YTRFICTSDTHARTFPIPPGDVLLHAGDLTNTGSLKDWEKTLEWLCAAECGVKIIIAGNHDVTLDEEWYDMNWTRFHKGIGRQDRTKILSLLTSPRAKAAGLVYLQDESFKFKVRPGGKEWVVYGSPWSPEFCDWAFGYPRDETAVKIARQIPECDILLTHSPPFSILDKTHSGEQVGCEALLERIKELRPRLSLFGHIHEGRGGEVWGWRAHSPTSTRDSEVPDNYTIFVNGASWPAGPRAARARQASKSQNQGGGVPRSHFGGLGFQPVIIDLLDV